MGKKGAGPALSRGWEWGEDKPAAHLCPGDLAAGVRLGVAESGLAWLEAGPFILLFLAGSSRAVRLPALFSRRG